jgi:hypothetical protein
VLRDTLAFDDTFLFNLLVSKKVKHALELYQALRSVIPEPGAADRPDELDEVFLMHGFYTRRTFGADARGLLIGWDGSLAQIGRAADFARPGRFETPEIAGAALRLHVVNPGGRPLRGATIVLSIVGATLAGQDVGIQRHEVVRLEWDGADLSRKFAHPDSERETITIWAEAGNRRSRETFTFTNREFWDAIAGPDGAGSGRPFALEATFTIPGA